MWPEWQGRSRMEDGFCDWWGPLESSVWTKERNSSKKITWGLFSGERRSSGQIKQVSVR